jgi:hypothetical protein
MRIACAAALLGLALPSFAEAACAPWPDEPAPLPTVDDDDAIRARWARLRLREISETARALADADPVRARVLWEHALCIAPGDPEAAQGAARRVGGVSVYRPGVVRAEQARAVDDAWTTLGDPIEIVSAPQRLPSRPRSARDAEVDALLAETADHVRAARFDAALASAERARSDLAALPGRARRTRSARLEVWAATAELALGRDAEARASLGRALDADPALRLDGATTSPKVRRALEDVRAERSQ